MQKNARLTLFSLFLLVVIDSMSIGMTFPVLAPLLLGDGTGYGILPADTSMGMRNFYYSAMLTTGAISLILGAPLIGYISDRIGRRKILLLSIFGDTIAYLCWALAIHQKSILLLLLGEAIDGLSTGGLALVRSAIIDVSPEDKKTSNLTIIFSAGIIGGIIGPLFGGFFANPSLFPLTGYATPFWIGACIALGNTLLLYFTFQETYQPGEIVPFSWKENFSSYISGFKHPKVRLLAVVLLMSEFAASLYIEFIMIYLVEVFQYNPTKLGLFLAYIGVLSLVSLNLVIPFVLRNHNEQKIVILSFLVCGFFILLAGFSPYELAQWLYVIPIFITFWLAEPCMTTIFSESVSKKEQGWVMGVFESLGAIAFLIAGMTVGGFNYVSLFLPFGVASLFILLSAFGVMKYSHERK